MFNTDHKHMLDDEIDHPNELLVRSKSRRTALVDTPDGGATFLTGDFSDSMKDLEREVRSQKDKWPFER